MFKKLQATEFAYKNAEIDFMNFIVQGLSSSTEVLNYIKYKHSTLEMSQNINIQLALGLYEGELGKKEALETLT